MRAEIVRGSRRFINQVGPTSQTSRQRKLERGLRPSGDDGENVANRTALIKEVGFSHANQASQGIRRRDRHRRRLRPFIVILAVVQPSLRDSQHGKQQKGREKTPSQLER